MKAKLNNSLIPLSTVKILIRLFKTINTLENKPDGVSKTKLLITKTTLMCVKDGMVKQEKYEFLIQLKTLEKKYGHAIPMKKLIWKV